MPCKEIQTKIAVDEALSFDERRHVETCRECGSFSTFDTSLADRLTHWRDSQTLPRRRPARRFRMVYASVALAATLTLGALLVPARSTAQTAYHRMIAGTRQVQSVHMIVRWRPGNGRVADGPMRKIYELWWKPGAWRETWEGQHPSLKREESGGLMFYRLDPKTGRVESYHEVSKQPDFRVFDLAAFAGQYMDTPVKFTQPSVDRIVTTNAGDWSRMIFTLEPKTALPIHAEKQSRDSKGFWTSAGEIDLEFDRPIPESRFEPESLREKTKP